MEREIISLLSGAWKVQALLYMISARAILDALARCGRDSACDIRGIYDLFGSETLLRRGREDPSRCWFLQDSQFAVGPLPPSVPRSLRSPQLNAQ